MLSRILHTFSSRVGIAGLNFLIVILTAQFLGAEGRGEISLFVANIAFVLLFTNLIGGTGLAYLTPRTNIYQLLLPSLAWSVVACGVATFGIFLAGQVLPAFVWHLFGLSLLQAFFTVNTTILVGKEKVKIFNYLNILQTLVTVLVLAGGFVLFQAKSVRFYLEALYWAYGLTTLISFFAVLRLPDRPDFSGFRQNLRHLVRFSSTAQLSNIIVFLNYRLSYYFLNTLMDPKAVGIFSVGVSLSEAIWMIGRSLALVQYGKLVNTETPEEAQRISTPLVKLSFAITTAAVLVLAIMPGFVFQFIFGREFAAVNQVIWSLSLGIIAMGTGTIFSHYFAGRGKYNINNLAALAGLAFTVPGCLLLIPRFGPVGAGLASTVSYLAIFAFSFWQFRRETGFKLIQILPGLADFRQLKALLRKREFSKK